MQRWLRNTQHPQKVDKKMGYRDDSAVQNQKQGLSPIAEMTAHSIL